MPSDLGYEAMRHLIDEVVFIHDEDRRVVFVSPSVEQVLGYTVAEFTQLTTIEIIHPDDLPEIARIGMALREQQGGRYRSTCRVKRADGSFVWCETVGRNLLHTETAGVVNTLRDISERRELEEQLFRQAFQDELTGLPNRRAFVQTLELEAKQTLGVGIGVLIVDLDGFKAVNDRFGHHAGDDALAASADALAGALREGDLAARLGGDEFAVLCRGVRNEADLRARGEAVRAACPDMPGFAAAARAKVSFSVGAALGRSGDLPAELLRSADRALYQAKRGGRDQVAFARR